MKRLSRLWLISIIQYFMSDYNGTVVLKGLTSATCIFLLDGTDWPHPQARTLADRQHVHCASAAVNEGDVVVGHPYSILAWMAEPGTSWALPVSVQRVLSLLSAAACHERFQLSSSAARQSPAVTRLPQPSAVKRVRYWLTHRGRFTPSGHVDTEKTSFLAYIALPSWTSTHSHPVLNPMNRTKGSLSGMPACPTISSEAKPRSQDVKASGEIVQVLMSFSIC
jgi:hypothetical protein